MLQDIVPRIKRYDIKSRIGEGGMGTLYLARDPNTDRLVAIKVLNAQIDSAEVRERFAREARSLAALNHPNVVSLYDYDDYRGAPCMVMEYVRGETVAEKISRKAPLSMGEKLKLMIELCAGLAHAHAEGLIHRDIKPANLMVDHDDRLKLLDFGIARSEVGLTRFGPQVTQYNVRIGTPGYMSPEQIEGNEIDARSDLFAVGTVLYELIAYREAFSGHTTRQIENKVLHSQPAPLRSIVPDLHPELETIVSTAMAKDPSERYQDAEDFAAALEHARGQLGIAANTPHARVRPITGVNERLKSHDRLADIAYQRARAFFEKNAHGAAKRHCLEALAEDSEHPGATGLLQELDPRGTWIVASARREVTPLPPTLVAESDAPSWAPTEFAMLARAGTAVSSEATVVAPRPNAAWRIPSEWKPYIPMAAIVASVIVMTGGIAWWVLSPGTPVLTLTVTKAAGGTISAPGIRCGTAATDCVTTLEKGAGVELQVEADKGFRFVGFTGDCAPGGRTVMNAARTCGAQFEEDTAFASATESELLTVATPSGGTIIGAGITCGSQGSTCSASRPRNSQLQLSAHADKGYTFLGFTGDCTQSGEAHMTGPRTCGAQFVSVRTPKLAPRSSPGSTPTPAPTPLTAVKDAPAVAPPATPTTEERDNAAKKDIADLLERYRNAYQALDFEALQRTYPTVHPAIRDQFNQMRSLSFVFQGTPKYVQLDAFGGTAVVEITTTISSERKSGGKGSPLQWTERINLHKRGADNQWVINSTQRK
jgi:hypothetical protein